MSYLDGRTGYREELLETRSVVKKNNYVILETDGLVKNSFPGYVNCDVTILGSPAMGATFVDYLVTMHEGGKNEFFGGEGIETFLYVVEGEVEIRNSDKCEVLGTGGYFFSPESNVVSFDNKGKEATLYIYKRRYEKVAGYEAYTIVGNADDLPWIEYEGMENCHIKNFLPAIDDFGFDMNFHILKFELGASHGYIETHLQQHGVYFLTGKGMYRVDSDWVPVKKGDYMFLDAYCPQACYGVGRGEPLQYIYSKDCNRDVQL